MAKIAVIGYGTIGKHIVKQAPKYGHEVCVVFTSKRVMDASGYGRPGLIRPDDKDIPKESAAYCVDLGVEYALLAIPSGGDGSTEASYITELTRRGIRVVTAGKSALANRFDEIQDVMKDVAYDATVGGGTMIPSFVREHLHVDLDHPFVLTAVMNGTLNYAQTRVRDGVSAEQICDEAIRLGFAEPPLAGKSLTPIEMYREEIQDVSRKIAILCNTQLRSLTGQIISQRDVRATPLEEDDLAKVMAGNSEYRYLVRICTRERDLEFFDDIEIGGKIRARIGNVWVNAGFVKLKGALKNWVPNHVGNAVQLTQNGDTDIKIGQGAGPVPTVGAMMSNLRRFVEAR